MPAVPKLDPKTCERGRDASWHDMLVARRLRDHHAFTAPPCQLGSHVICHLTGGDVNQPIACIVGHTLRWPLHRDRKERLLQVGTVELRDGSRTRREIRATTGTPALRQPATRAT